MAKKIELSIIVPAFNEEKRLVKRFPPAYKKIKKHLKSFELIFVNDGSKDQTEKVFKRIAKGKRNIRIITYQPNQGKGYAVKKGVEIAEGKIIGFTDADFAIDLNHLKQVVEEFNNGAELVIGDRKSKLSKLKNKPDILRRILSKTHSVINNFFLNLGPIKDTLCGFKFFKAQVAKELFSTLSTYRWFFDLEILIKARNRKLRIIKLPVSWEEIEGSKVSYFSMITSSVREHLILYGYFFNRKMFAFLLSGVLLVILAPFLINPTGLTKRNGDFSDLVWPDYYFVKQNILEFHQIPLWNPTLFSGIPEIANPQSPIIYPVNVIALFLPIDVAIVLIYFTHAFVGGLFLFLLTREKLKWSTLASVATSFTFVFSPFFWSKIAIGHLSQIFAIFLTAPILYFGFIFWQTKKWRYMFFTAMILSMQYLNYPTIWYFTCFFGAIFILSEFLQKKEKWTLRIFLVPILSLFFILPIFLQQLQAGPLITRSILNFNDLAIPIWSFSRFFKSILIPSNFLADNETEVWLYPSLVALFLAIYGFLKLKKNYRNIFGVIIILVTLITLGGRTPIFAFLTKYFPGFSYLRVSTRDWFVMITIIAFLVGFAIEKLPQKIRKIVFGLLIVDLIFFSTIRIWIVPDFMQPKNSLNFSNLFQPSTQFRTYCTSRCLSARDTLPSGVITADGYHLLILQNYRLAISEAGGFNPPEYTGNLPTYSVAGAQPSAEKLGLMSVKWVISRYELTDRSFIWQRTDGDYNLYENRLAKKRFYFRRKEDENQTHFKKINNNLIKVIKDTPNEILLETSGEQGILVIADNFYPGWEAFIDSQKVAISKENEWARSIIVADGEHSINLKFDPFNNLINNDF